VKKDNKEKFQGNLLRLVDTKLCNINKEGGTYDLDITLCTRVSDESDIEKLIEEFHEVLKLNAANHSEHNGPQRKQCQISQCPGGQRN
jgi:hypothetical protein